MLHLELHEMSSTLGSIVFFFTLAYDIKIRVGLSGTQDIVFKIIDVDAVLVNLNY